MAARSTSAAPSAAVPRSASTCPPSAVSSTPSMSELAVPAHQQTSALKRSLGLAKLRLKGRADSEHEQAIVRIVIVGILAIYFLTLAWIHDFSDERFLFGAIWATGYLAVSIGYVAAIIISPAISPLRRIIAMVTDM